MQTKLLVMVRQLLCAHRQSWQLLPADFLICEVPQMTKLKKQFIRFIKEEDAPTMVEYGLLVALIAIIVIGGATALGGAVNGTFNSAAGEMP